jgi:hypothetical protein
MERVLWIDAMCINQKDIDERNRQVWLMGQVYSKAKAVIIWLGPQSEDSDLAMEFIPRLLGALFTPVNQLLRTENRDLIFPSTRRADVPEWQAFETLLNRPWFERLWVIQELLLAKAAVVAYGQRTLPAEDILNIAKGLYSAHGEGMYLDTECQPRTLAHLMRIQISREQHMKGRVLTPEHNFYSWKDCKATDPRDRFFGVLA